MKRLGLAFALVATAALAACGTVGGTIPADSSRSAEVLRAIPVPSAGPAATPAPDPTPTPAPRKPHVLRAIPVPSGHPSPTPAPHH